MAQPKYGSITIVDLNDKGQLSVFPTSNMPLSVIYDPDQNTYTPNWSSTNLILTPVIYYNSQQLTATTSGLTITWKRREGTGNITDLTTGETKQSDGSLKVTANKFTPTSSMISYIVTASYKEPETQTTLIAEGQITFSLVKLASSAKTCIISGGNVFKYNSSQALVSDSSIILTAKLNNVSIQEWQYKDATGAWVKYPDSGKTETLTVNETDDVFVNDTAIIQLTTTDTNVYDIHSITKLRDGAPGDNAVTAVLSNEDQMIAFPNTGSPDYSQAVSQIFIYNGGKIDTQNWTITQSKTSNLTTTTSKTVVDNDTVAVTAMTGDTGSVTFTCKRSGFADVVKRFSVVKVAQGADGKTPVIYSIVCEALVINKTTPVSGSPVYTPATIKITAYSQTGMSAPTEYAGRIKIMSDTTTIHSVNTNEKTYTLTSSDMANATANGYMTVELYEAGGTTKLLDKQTIVITSDGAKGEQGDAGQDAINVVMGNYADVIPCTSGNKPISEFVIDIPFTGYKGTTQVACNVATPAKVLNVTAQVIQATATAVGHVKYTIPTTTEVELASGTLSLSFTCEGKTVIHTYTWARSTAATNGINARLFELYTLGGNVFTSRESQDITIYGRLMDGATDKTTSCTDWTWAKWQDGAYTTISDQTASSIKINNSSVEGFASYRCTCKYSGTTYTAYYSLIDKLDPLQATAICSLGEQIINGQGVGALYVLVTDTGTGAEIDPLKSSRFLTSAPDNPVIGDYYYHLDATNKNVVLKKYDGEKWIDAEDSELPTGDYTWSFRDKNGNPTTLNKQSQIKGKVIYVDGTLINNKIIADVKAEIAKTTTYGSTTITSYNSIINTEVYYYKSSSATELIDGEWSMQQPEWEENKYIWQKIRTLYEDGTATESEAANISGQQGQSGISAISYKLNATQNIITKLNTGEYSINSITFNSTYKQGDTETSDYLGRFTIQHLSNNSEWIVDYISSINESTITYELLEDTLAIRCLLYRGGGTDILLDLLTIPVIKESSDGKDATGLIGSLPIYLASNRDSEVKITDIGWTRYKPELTNDKRYLWSYQVLRYASGDSNPELIKLQGETIDFEYHGETSPLEEVIVDINFVQQGSGDPSPDNIRPITGWSAINISSSDISLQAYGDGKYQLMMSSAHGTIEENILQINDDNITIEDNIMIIENTAPSYNIIFPASIGTVYKGYLNVTTGTLTVTYGYIDSYAGETIDGIWISDRDIYVEGTAPTIGAQVIYELSTPLTYKLTPQEILALSGANRIWADTGDMSISYYDGQKTTEPIIDQSLTSVIEMTQDVASKVMATYGESSSSAGDMIKVVDCENFELYEGARLQIAFENSNTVLDQLFLDVNNTGSKAIYVQNEPVSDTNQLIWGADTLMEFVYTNDGWHLQNAPFSLFGLSDTLANQANKMVNCEHCVICKGTSLSVNMNHTNTVANATLNIDSTIPVLIHANGRPLTTNSRFNWRANTTQKFVFDGQVWRMDDDSVKALATAYITEIDDDGIMVHPEDDDTSGWAISDAIQLFKSGISYIKLWIENNIPKIRIGKEDQGHIILDNDSVDIRNDDKVLASFGATSVIGDENDWHQTIAANQITFAKGDDIITYISPDKLYTINAEVADAFYISNYSIRNASDGKLVIGLRR